MIETTLHQNAFWRLQATARDDRRRIVELAEDRILDHDNDACQKARSDLTSPRQRLAAEMGWLPGVSPRRATELAMMLLKDPTSVRTEAGLPRLARANLMAAAFEAVNGNNDPVDLANFIVEIALVVDGLSVDEITQDVNEDRAVSRFPLVQVEPVEAELAERKRYYRSAIKEALNRLPTASLVDAMTRAVDIATRRGASHAPELVDELVDSYEVEAQDFLQKEAANASILIAAIREAAKTDPSTTESLIGNLARVVRKWDTVAQPIQLSAKARGLDHSPSNELGFMIRSLAVDLFNEHDLIEQAKRITGLLQEVFAELPQLSERTEEDTDALEGIVRNRQQAESQQAKWAEEIKYEADVGILFKDRLSISPQGVTWNNQSYLLGAVTRIRWGGVRHSVNGIPTGTTYTIGFGDDRSEAVAEFRKEEVFSAFVDRLWRAVGIRLLMKVLGELRSGKEARFGSSSVKDDGIMLTRHKFWSSEAVWLPWHAIQISSVSGSFHIEAKDDAKVYTSLSYIEVPNTHVLEHAIRMAFKRGCPRLSDLLSSEA